MKEAERLDRREFTLAAALAALSGVAITITACGGGADYPSSPTPPSTGDKVGVIGANHGHSAIITAAQLSAGGDLSLNIRGTSDHPHMVTLDAGEMTAIASNVRVSVESTTDDGHSHRVIFN